MFSWERMQLELLQLERMQRLRNARQQREARGLVLPTPEAEAAGPTGRAIARRQVRSPLVRETMVELFTAEQLTQMDSLRQQATVLRLSEEYGLDVRRLLFVRWLVENGRLSENL